MTDKNQKLAWLIYFLFMLPLISILISNIIYNDNEGYVAAYFSIMQFFAILIFGILGVSFAILGFLGNNDNITPISGLGLMLILLFMVFFYFSKTKNKAYNAVFEDKKTVITDNYALLDVPNSRSPNEYFLYIGEHDISNTNERVYINEKTYRKLISKNSYVLTITYQPKAQILYDLQIAPK